MADLLIHRCTLRVVRRGGWSWGPSRKQLVDRLVRGVSALLARVLADLLPEEAQQEIAAPVRIRVPIRSQELISLASNSNLDWPASDSAVSRAFRIGVEQALQVALNAPAGESESRVPASRPTTGPGRQQATQRRRGVASALACVLVRWHERGTLQPHLNDASREELESWHGILRGGHHGEPSEPSGLAAIPVELQEFVSFRVPRHPCSREAILRIRVQIAVEAAATFRIALHEPELWRLLDSAIPLDSSPPRSDSDVTDKTQPPSSDSWRPAAVTPLEPSHPTRPSVSWEAHISCALPFLLLGPLASLAFFDAMSAALQAASACDAGPLLAAGLAYKVLDPPDRGWLRSPASLAAAAAFAGRQCSIDESQLVELARRIAPFTKLLDRVNSDALLAGHTAGEPFLVAPAKTQEACGYFLFDTHGCFPVLSFEEPDSLPGLLSRVADPVVVVSREAASTGLLESLGRSGITFVVDVEPVRGERWSRVPLGPGATAWTNHSQLQAARAIRAALQLPQASEEAAKFREQLGSSRVSAVRAPSPNLDRSLTLAAGTALGTIAWKLWEARGRTTPQLTLERFRDLDAYVKFTDHVVTVRLPLGRRHRELFDRGLLAPVDGAFWLGDRRVEFAGG